MHEGSRTAIVAAFLANLGIAATKFVAFLLTRSLIGSVPAEGLTNKGCDECADRSNRNRHDEARRLAPDAGDE